MFEFDKDSILYNREDFSYAELLFEYYMKMREAMKKVECIKYGKEDKIFSSEEFKQGFIAGVKIMSSILMDV